MRGGQRGVDLPLGASVTSPRSGDLPMLLKCCWSRNWFHISWILSLNININININIQLDHANVLIPYRSANLPKLPPPWRTPMSPHSDVHPELIFQPNFNNLGPHSQAWDNYISRKVKYTGSWPCDTRCGAVKRVRCTLYIPEARG